MLGVLFYLCFFGLVCSVWGWYELLCFVDWVWEFVDRFLECCWFFFDLIESWFIFVVLVWIVDVVWWCVWRIVVFVFGCWCGLVGVFLVDVLFWFLESLWGFFWFVLKFVCWVLFGCRLLWDWNEFCVVLDWFFLFGERVWLLFVEYLLIEYVDYVFWVFLNWWVIFVSFWVRGCCCVGWCVVVCWMRWFGDVVVFFCVDWVLLEFVLLCDVVERCLVGFWVVGVVILLCW